MRHHKPISHLRWSKALKQALLRWKKLDIAQERARLERHQLPLLQRYAKQLPTDGAILEIGCGPICISRLLPQQHKTYLDPLIDDYRRIFPGELPEDGEFIASMGERINKPSASYDLIICMNVLSFAMNPELILNEVERLLKPHGKCIIGMRTHSALEARLHYLLIQLCPGMCNYTRPYYYALPGILRTLSRHFHVEQQKTRKQGWFQIPLFKREEHLFICSKKTHAT